jgi:AraC family ethanolamine operon transcriptional activator
MDSTDQLAASPPRIIHQCFRDVDELAAMLSLRRQVQVNQLSLQAGQTQLLQAKFDQVQFLLIQSGCPLQVIGPKCGDFVDFACIVQPQGSRLIAHHIEVTSDILFGFDSDREINLVLPADLKLATIQVRRSAFEDCLQLMGRSDIDHRFLSQNFLRSPVLNALLADYLNQLFWLTVNQTDFLQQTHLQRMVLEDFLPLLVGSLPAQPDKRLRPPKPFRRAELVDQTEAYMQSNLDQPLTLKDLCGIINTSSRALNYGFQDVFGMGPMAYLKILRLHGVRRVLKTANPEATLIADVAARFGFWSLGHFCRDYQAMFGEKPSETLK